MTDYSSVGLNRQLYYSIRPNNSENTLHAWMHHILTYLTNRNELAPNDVHGPPLPPDIGCDGSCDCQSNLWVHEVSYEEHYRKLLMSRVNVGDANDAASVDEESLRREASLVMESANQHSTMLQDHHRHHHHHHHQPVPSHGAEESITLMHVDDAVSSAASSEYEDWDFVIYGSDLESEVDSDDDSSCATDDDDDDDGGFTSEDEFATEEDSEYDEGDDVSENMSSGRSNHGGDDEDDDDDDDMSNYVYDISCTTSFQLETNNVNTINHKCRQLGTEENLVAEDYPCRRKSGE